MAAHALSSLQSALPSGLHAKVRWAHIYRSLEDSGDLAKMDGSTVKVYLVLKFHTDLQDGVINIGVEAIAKKAGISRMQVWRALRQLEQMGYVTTGSEGRHHIYQLREQIPLVDADGKNVGLATWPYQPVQTQAAVEELKQALASGDVLHTALVHIELSPAQEVPIPPPEDETRIAASDQTGGEPRGAEEGTPDAIAVLADEEGLVPSTLKDPELRTQLERLGAMILAAERHEPTTRNTHVTSGGQQG